MFVPLTRLAMIRPILLPTVVVLVSVSLLVMVAVSRVAVNHDASGGVGGEGREGGGETARDPTV